MVGVKPKNIWLVPMIIDKTGVSYVSIIKGQRIDSDCNMSQNSRLHLNFQNII